MPKLTTGLVSVGVLAQKGFDVAFNASGCEVRKGNGKVCAMGERHNGLYRLCVPDQALMSAHMQTSFCRQHTCQGNRMLDVMRNKKTEAKKYSKKKPEVIGTIIEWEELLPVPEMPLEPELPAEPQPPLEVQSASAMEPEQSLEEELESEDIDDEEWKGYESAEDAFYGEDDTIVPGDGNRERRPTRSTGGVLPKRFGDYFVGMVTVNQEELPLFDVMVKHQPMVFGCKI